MTPVFKAEVILFFLAGNELPVLRKKQEEDYDVKILHGMYGAV